MKVKILDPKPNSFSHHTLNLRGSYQDIPENYNIWIVTIQENTQSYHPQNSPALLDNGEWDGTAYIGSSKPNIDTGIRFRILMVACEINVNVIFQKYTIKNTSTGQPTGFNKLPYGK